MSVKSVVVHAEPEAYLRITESRTLIAGNMTLACDLHKDRSVDGQQYNTLVAEPLDGWGVISLLEELAPVKEHGVSAVIDDWEMPDDSEPMCVDLTRIHAKLGHAWTEFEAERGIFLTVLRQCVKPEYASQVDTNATRLRPILRWRESSHDDGSTVLPTAMLTHMDSQAQISHNSSRGVVVDSRVAGALVAVALVPAAYERWPEVMKLPESDRSQFMHAAQVPILALMSLRKALKQLDLS